jgi:heptosyltransferase III
MNKIKEPIIKKVARCIVFNGINILSVIISWKKPKKNKTGNIFPLQILAIELARLGDLLISFPLYASIRKTFPDAKLCLVCTPASKEAISNSGFFDEIYCYEAFWEDATTKRRPTLKHLRATIDLYLFFKKHFFTTCFAVSCRKQPFVPFFSFLSGAETRVGFSYGSGDNFLTNKIPLSNDHFCYAKLELLKSAFPHAKLSETNCYSISAPNKNAVREYLKNKIEQDKPYLCISASSAQANKAWNIEKWVDVINWINSKNYYVFLSGGKSDLAYVSRIHEKVNNKSNCINCAAQFTVNQFAGLLEHSQGLITVESAPMHLASLLNIPCLVLMSRIYDYKRFVPLSQKTKILAREVDCSCCEKGCDNPQCMDFSAEEVIRSLQEFLFNGCSLKLRQPICKYYLIF